MFDVLGRENRILQVRTHVFTFFADVGVHDNSLVCDHIGLFGEVMKWFGLNDDSRNEREGVGSRSPI